MFRTAVRQFAATALRAAGTVQEMTMAEIESSFSQGINISKAQGIARRGLIDGKYNLNTSTSLLTATN